MRRLRTVPLAALAAATAAGIASGPTSAQTGDAKPTPCADQLAYRDAASDRLATDGNVQAAGIPTTDSSEILRGFLRYDPAKGADALTYNVVVKNLKAEVPSGATTLSWVSYYRTPDDTLRFVRAITDFTGATVFEYGNFTPNPTGVGLTGVSVYEGTTNGKMFEGPEGIVQLVIPAAHAPAGTKLTTLYTNTTQGRTLPTSFPPQVSRGVSTVIDTAPDDAPDTAPGTFTVAECVAPPPAAAVTGPTSGPAVLPVKLTSSSVKAPKGKSMSLKVRSSEEITNLTARLRKGSKKVGSGSLAKFSGSATLKLKLTSKVKKGNYILDLAGTNASGQRGTSSLKLKVK